MKKATKYNEAELAAITEIQQKHNLTRKTAIKRFQASRKAGVQLPAVGHGPKQISPDTGHVNPAPAVTPTPVVAVPQKADKKQREPKAAPVRLTAEQVSANRSAGIKLFQLSGKPSKTDFVVVFGEAGPRWTWEQRAAARKYSSAEECAANFQSDLQKARVNLTDKAGIATQAGR